MEDIFRIAKSDDSMTLFLKGRISVTVADELISNVMDQIKGIKNLYLDIKEVEYISSAGLRFVLMLQNQIDDADGEMTVSSCNDVVKDTFNITGFSSFLNWDI